MLNKELVVLTKYKYEMNFKITDGPHILNSISHQRVDQEFGEVQLV